MLEIKPVQEKKEQERIALLCGMEYLPDDLMYAAYVDGALVGASQFGYTARRAWIHHIAPAPQTEDWDALFIMGRQTVNFIDLSGTHEAWMTPQGEAQCALARRIGFREQEDGTWYMNLAGFFDHPCQHT